ncbi:MAG: hypothetical protein QS721_11260 [Candidatus Endonucleobacter sp. (ex Gigantidas childressi)]|nr:hypothetical protein [Candidatus Endonucleobacter sp. (ex Gigantidas childressi)]
MKILNAIMQKFSPTTQKLTAAYNEKAKRTKNNRVKQTKVKSALVDSCYQSQIYKVKLGDRLCSAWANFSTSCKIAWKKVCLNCCILTNGDRSGLQSEINKLQSGKKRMNLYSKAKDHLEAADGALNNGDIVGVSKSAAKCMINMVKGVVS